MTGGWWERAACRGGDTGLWFPDGETGMAVLDAEEAKAVCRACPVVEACLEAALREEGGRGMTGRYGIRGGLSARQRHRVYQNSVRLRARGRVS